MAETRRSSNHLRPALAEFRERVIANAEIAEGETVLDVGTGDGLIAFDALEREWPCDL